MLRGRRTAPSEFVIRGIMQRKQMKVMNRMKLGLLCWCLSLAVMACGVEVEEGKNAAGIHNTQSTDNINSIDKTWITS